MSLIPATDLAASYQPQTQTLRLYARGEVSYLTLGIHFKRDRHWYGGFRAQLRGWIGGIGPARITVQKPYDYKQDFIVPDLPIVVPSNEVIIVTSNHPNGQAVPIHWLGYGEDEPNDPFAFKASKSLDQPSTSASPKVLSADTVLIDTLVGGTFTIKEALPPTSTGIIDIDYNPYLLKIDGSGVSQGNITWTFTAIEGGVSTIIVDLIPSLPSPGEVGLALVRTIYKVVALYPVDTGPGPVVTASDDGETLTFLGRVNEAVNIVQKKWKEAELLNVLATRPWIVFPPSQDPVDLSALYVTFRVEKGTVVIRSKGIDGWHKPELLGGVPPLGIEQYNIKGLKDIVPAYHALRKAGVRDLIQNVNLNKPLLEGPSVPERQPWYNFRLENGETTKVGAEDLKVELPVNINTNKKAATNGA